MDSVFTILHRDPFLIDVVDEAWAADCLSDDDIDVPNIGGQQDDSEELNGTTDLIFDSASFMKPISFS